MIFFPHDLDQSSSLLPRMTDSDSFLRLSISISIFADLRSFLGEQDLQTDEHRVLEGLLGTHD